MNGLGGLLGETFLHDRKFLFKLSYAIRFVVGRQHVLPFDLGALPKLGGMLGLTKRRVSLGPLIELAASLGSDVPFFLLGGRALGAGRGEEIYPLPEVARKYLLLVSPHDLAVSTAEAYGWLSPSLTKEAIPSKIYGFCTLCWSPLESALPNDFQAAVFGRYPRLKKIQRELLRHGAVEASLAGSGSTVFGIFRSPAQARRTARLFPDDHTFCTETLTREECARARRWRAVAE